MKYIDGLSIVLQFSVYFQSSNMACCPEGSLGRLGTEGYVDKVCFINLTTAVHWSDPIITNQLWNVRAR